MKANSAHDNIASHSRGEDEQPLQNAWKGVERFFFTPTEPTTLGLMRIVTGIIIVYVQLSYSLDLDGYIGPDTWILNRGLTDHPQKGEEGVIDFLRHGNPQEAPSTNWSDNPLEENAKERANGKIFKGATMWSIYYHVEDRFWIRVIHYTILLCMILFTVGLWTRVMSVLTWIGALMYIQRLPGMLFGMDTMTNLGLFYLMFAPCGAALSVDRWLKVRRERQRQGAAYVPMPPEPLVSATFVTRALQINFCLIYLASGTSKLLGSSWWNATAPNRFLLNYSFAPFDVEYYEKLLKFMTDHRWLWEVQGTIGVVFTLIIEIGFPFLVWNRSMRWFFVCGSILLHTAIALLMGLVTFSLMMLALVVVFVPPEAVRLTLQSWSDWLHQVLLGRGNQTQGQSVALSR